MLPDHPLANLLTLIILGYAAYYALLCTVSPFGRHRRCNGTGRKGRTFRRDCYACHGTGRRVRIGRRLWTHIAREYRDGTR